MGFDTIEINLVFVAVVGGGVGVLIVIIVDHRNLTLKFGQNLCCFCGYCCCCCCCNCCFCCCYYCQCHKPNFKVKSKLGQ